MVKLLVEAAENRVPVDAMDAVVAAMSALPFMQAAEGNADASQDALPVRASSARFTTIFH